MADEPKTYTEDEVAARIAEANRALEKKRDELLTEAKAAKKAAADLREQHEQATARLQELEQNMAAQSAGVGDEKLKELREQMRADFERQYTPYKTRVGELEASLGEKDSKIRELLLDNNVKDILGKAGARAERVEDLFRLTRDRYDLTDSGEVILKDNREVPLDKWAREELSNEYPEFWNGSGSSGGGASRSTAGGGGNVRTIAAGDGAALLANLEGVAKGQVAVR